MVAAFIPNPLPPDPPIDISRLVTRLSEADRALASLDAIRLIIPDPETFVWAYARKDAVLSSQIEGLHTTFADVLEAESNLVGRRIDPDLGETLNYLAALNHMLKESSLPLSLRLIREAHEILLSGVRGQEREPGEFRRTQNWIGPSGSTLHTATYVPPPADEMKAALYELELFMHRTDDLPPLVKIALIHSQFETIHPFLDGNGRVGRLLITYLMIHYNLISQPILYISLAMRLNRDEYYARLQAVRDEDAWEEWIQFFLSCVSIAARDGIERAKEILKLRRDCERTIVNREPGTGASLLRILDSLFRGPIITASTVVGMLDCSHPTAIRHLKSLKSLGILQEIGRHSTGLTYSFGAYLEMLYRETVSPEEAQPPLFD